MSLTLGQKMRHLRESRQFTQEYVSRQLYIERCTYTNYEKDKRIPSYRFLILLADFYSVSPEYLMRDDFDAYAAGKNGKPEKLLALSRRLGTEAQQELLDFGIYLLRKQLAKSKTEQHAQKLPDAKDKKGSS